MPTLEIPIRLVPTDEYRTRKAALTNEQARLSLELAEEAIAVDPYHRSRRHERNDGLVIDRNERGILVAFRVVDEETVHLVDFRVVS